MNLYYVTDWSTYEMCILNRLLVQWERKREREREIEEQAYKWLFSYVSILAHNLKLADKVKPIEEESLPT